jgi:hypothetical protein
MPVHDSKHIDRAKEEPNVELRIIIHFDTQPRRPTVPYTAYGGVM